jgi:hypothetical protein
MGFPLMCTKITSEPPYEPNSSSQILLKNIDYHLINGGATTTTARMHRLRRNSGQWPHLAPGQEDAHLPSRNHHRATRQST